MRVNDDYTQCNAEQQLVDPTSVFSHWRRVLELRRQHCGVFVYGRFEIVDREHPAVFCYRRIDRTPVPRLWQISPKLNKHGSLPRAIEDALRSGTTILANYETPTVLHSYNLVLRPFEAFVILEQGSSHRL